MNKLKGATLAMGMLAVVSCNTKQGTGSLIGAGGGALIGGIIGKLAGNTAVGAAIGGAVGAGTGALIGRHMDKVAEQAKQIENAKVEKVTDSNGLESVKVTFDSGILFATNKADLNASSKSALAKFSNTLKENNLLSVDIYGHTDSTGNDGINVLRVWLITCRAVAFLIHSSRTSLVRVAQSLLPTTQLRLVVLRTAV